MPVIVAIAIICLFVLYNFNISAAVENENDKTVRSVKVSAGSIENSSLVIGSHIIHINGLTDDLYAIAQESANEFNQNMIYYKSELADGKWFEITTATSVTDITGQGTPVDDGVISALEFTHSTNAKGETTDLRTGEKVSIYDIPDPYDLESMPELEPLKIQYQLLQEKDIETDSDEIYKIMIVAFYKEKIDDGETAESDLAINGMNTYKCGLSERGKSATWAEAVDSVMEQEDAKRRVKSLTTLSEILDELLNKASGLEQGGDYGYSIDEDFDVNQDIVAAVGDCMENVETSILKYTSLLLKEGTTTSSMTRYRYANDLINNGKAGSTGGCDTATQKLVNLENIINGKMVDMQSELELLQAELISEAYMNYSLKLAQGVNEKYQAAVTAGESQAVKTNCLMEQRDETNAARFEYQSLLEEQFKRMTSTAAQSYILTLIDGIPSLESMVPGDEVSSYQLETVAEHLEWLQDDLAELVKNDSDDTELEEKLKAKADLERRRQEALDNNDLKEMKRLTAEMEAKQKEIDELIKKLLASYNSGNSSPSDKAKALAALGEGNPEAMISELANSIESDIRNQKEGDIDSKVAALAAVSELNPEAADAAIKDIKDTLLGSEELTNEVKNKIQGQMAEIEQNVNKLKNQPKLTNEKLISIIEKWLGNSFDNSNEEKQAATIWGLCLYADEFYDQETRALALSFLNQFGANQHSYIYMKYNKDKEEYVPLDSVAKVLGYRYIFDDVHYTVTLSAVDSYYTFIMNQNKYEMADGNYSQLSKPAGYMNTLYVPSKDTEEIYSIKAGYIDNTDYAILLTKGVESRANELLALLKEG